MEMLLAFIIFIAAALSTLNGDGLEDRVTSLFEAAIGIEYTQ